MPQTCSICTHPERDAIDAELLSGTANRRIATQYSLSEAAVRRHRKSHLPAELIQAQEAQAVAQADDLLAQVVSLKDKALKILGQAETEGDLRTALAAIRETRSTLELLARLLGELREQTTVNVLVSPEWVQLRTTILTALEPFPEARLHVAGVLAHAH